MTITPLPIVGTGMVTDGELDSFTAWLRSWGASERTISERTTALTAGLRDWGPYDQSTAEQLAHWLGQPRFSPWTRVTYHSHLRSYFGWLHDTGRIPTNPAADLRAPRAPKDKPRPLTSIEVDHALTAATGRLHTWLILGLFAGLRAHEMAKLQGQDVNHDSLYVLGKGQQGAMLPTHELVWEEAQAYPRRGWWFPARTGTGHVNSRSISTMTSRLFGSLGIDGSIHRCRHTYGTWLLRGGANIRVVQTLLRHESLATTERYTDVGEDERSAAIRGLVA